MLIKFANWATDNQFSSTKELRVNRVGLPPRGDGTGNDTLKSLSTAQMTRVMYVGIAHVHSPMSTVTVVDRQTHPP